MTKLKMMVLTLLVSAVLPGALAQRNSDRDQANMRAVQGVITGNADTLVEGAVVQLKDTKSLQIRSFITKGDGSYHFNGLSKDIDYELRAEHQGSASGSKTLSSFDNRKVAIINIKIGK